MILNVNSIIIWRLLGLKLKTKTLPSLEKLSYNFCLKTLRDNKVKAAKDHSKKFQSRLAASFSGIAHYFVEDYIAR